MPGGAVTPPKTLKRGASRAFWEGSLPLPTRRLLLEVLGEHRHLPLVVGPETVAIQPLGRGAGPLQGKLADRLAVLDHEGDVAGAYLERGAAAVAGTGRVVAEAG